MKLLVTIFSLLLTTTFALANSLGNTENQPSIIEKSNDSRGGGSDVSSGTEVGESSKPANHEEDLILESDSSEYSVNKFNYLFYLIYKVKFLDIKQELEAMEEEPVELLD